MKALIIGGGIAGPAVAMFLRRAGVESVIYEAQPDPMDNTGLFMNLAVNGMSVLNLLGVESRVRAYGTPATGITLYNSSGKSIGRVDNSHEKQRYGLTNVMIKRGLLHRALREAALEQGIQIEYGKKLIRIEEQGVAHFEDGTQAQGDFLIGCDGLHSRTRRLMLPDAPPPNYTGLIDCGGFAYLPSITPSSDQQMIFGKKAFFGYFTAPDGEIFWFSNLAANEPARGEWKQKLLDLYANDLPLISEIIQATKGDIRAWAIHDFPSLPTWHKGRICLVGDAAHATSPHIGQGASLALEDAAVLARCLRDIPKLEQAFSTYEHLRKARVEKLIQQARRTGNQKAVSNPVMGWIRDLMLPFFIKMGAKSMEWVYSYRVDWDSKVA